MNFIDGWSELLIVIDLWNSVSLFCSLSTKWHGSTDGQKERKWARERERKEGKRGKRRRKVKVRDPIFEILPTIVSLGRGRNRVNLHCLES